MFDIVLELLSITYAWTKALHIVSVISWMAGLFYLPRLFVHHVERAGLSGETHDIFVMMESKLYRIIMKPAMIATWVFGALLFVTPGLIDWTMAWVWVKLLSVLLMTVFHEWLGVELRRFRSGETVRTGKFFRFMNEVPTVLMLLIVFSVVLKY